MCLSILPTYVWSLRTTHVCTYVQYVWLYYLHIYVCMYSMYENVWLSVCTSVCLCKYFCVSVCDLLNWVHMYVRMSCVCQCVCVPCSQALPLCWSARPLKTHLTMSCLSVTGEVGMTSLEHNIYHYLTEAAKFAASYRMKLVTQTAIVKLMWWADCANGVSLVIHGHIPSFGSIKLTYKPTSVCIWIMHDCLMCARFRC